MTADPDNASEKYNAMVDKEVKIILDVIIIDNKYRNLSKE